MPCRRPGGSGALTRLATCFAVYIWGDLYQIRSSHHLDRACVLLRRSRWAERGFTLRRSRRIARPSPFLHGLRNLLAEKGVPAAPARTGRRLSSPWLNLLAPSSEFQSSGR